jgi:CheY-like chemotaxis protein
MSASHKILVIDDERDIVQGLTLRLRAAGYDVLTATDGARGVGMALTAAPDAILLDIRMPGMDGLAVLSALQQHTATRHIPVIVVSANVVENVRASARAAGARWFVGKPYQGDKLLSMVAEAVSPNLSGRATGSAEVHDDQPENNSHC